MNFTSIFPNEAFAVADARCDVGGEGIFAELEDCELKEVFELNGDHTGELVVGEGDLIQICVVA